MNQKSPGRFARTGAFSLSGDKLKVNQALLLGLGGFLFALAVGIVSRLLFLLLGVGGGSPE